MDAGDKDRPVDHDRRLEALDERLERLDASEASRTGRDRPYGTDPNVRMGNRVLADLIGGVAGGALIGWLVDRLFDSSPWGFLIFLALGIGAAFRNIMRIANGGATTASPRGDERVGAPQPGDKE